MKKGAIFQGRIMKKKMRKLTAILLAVSLAMALVACGKEEGNKKVEEEEGEYVWVPEFETLQMEDENGWMFGIRMIKGVLYYAKESWDSETMTSSYSICKHEDGKETVIYQKENTETANEGVNSFIILPEGKLGLVVSGYAEEETSWYLRIIGEDGTEIITTEITEAVMGDMEYGYVAKCLSDKEGNLYLQCDQWILVYDINGEFLFQLNSNGNWIQDMGNTKDGQVLVLQYSGSDMELSTIDMGKKDFAISYQGLPTDINTMEEGITKDVLFKVRTGLVEYDFESQSYEEVLNWIDCDINPDYVEAVSSTKDGKILVIIREWGSTDGEYQLCTLTQTLKSEVPEKQTITLGTIGLSQGLQNAIVNFNKTNQEYRIRVIDYTANVDYSKEGAYEDALLGFNNDILTRNAPDIIDLSAGNFVQYMNQGMIEDLYPYLDSSDSVNKENFLQSVLEAYSVDGKLACIPSTVYITTMAAKASDVGTKQGWTFEELLAVADSKPADTLIMQYATKNEILRMSLMFDEESYIDWSTGECNFDSEEFKKVLEFANRFPSEYDWSVEMPSEPALIAEGKLLLMPITISAMNDIQTYTAMYGNEDVTYIGYPTADGSCGSAFSGQDTLAISSQSDCKEGAWMFIESLLTEDYQTGMFSWGMPTLKSAYDAQLKDAMRKQYEMDEEGNILLDEEGNPIESSQGGMSYGDGWSVDYYAVTQEEADQIEELIANTQRVINYNYASEVYKIIEEEAAPYFAGQKPLDEVVDIIQSRVDIYISENM